MREQANKEVELLQAQLLEAERLSADWKRACEAEKQGGDKLVFGCCSEEDANSEAVTNWCTSLQQLGVAYNVSSANAVTPEDLSKYSSFVVFWSSKAVESTRLREEWQAAMKEEQARLKEGGQEFVRIMQIDDTAIPEDLFCVGESEPRSPAAFWHHDQNSGNVVSLGGRV